MALDRFVEALLKFGIEAVVDVRRFPGSRRNPQFGADELARALGEAGLGYENAIDLGGRRRARADSVNSGFRNEAFRGYADYMETPEFGAAFARLIRDSHSRHIAIMCSETLWWRCHRRLIADAAVLLADRPVEHIVNGVAKPHVLTEGVRLDGRRLRYGTGPLGV